MVDGAEFERWRREAAHALEIATLGERHNWRCFLAEQAAQLAVKALLHGLGTGPWGHDLVQLGRAWAGALDQPLPEEVIGALTRLSRLYIPTRYPDAQPSGTAADHYTAADAEQAIADARLVISTVDDLWGQLQT